MKPSKADIFLMIGLIIFSLFFYVIFGFFAGNEKGAVAEVSVDGEIYKILPLWEDAEIKIQTDGHTNIIRVEKGSVSMTESDCHDKICVNQGKISKTGESIICLPNRVVITVKGASGGDYDAIAG